MFLRTDSTHLQVKERAMPLPSGYGFRRKWACQILHPARTALTRRSVNRQTADSIRLRWSGCLELFSSERVSINCQLKEKATLLPSGYRFRRIMSLSSPPPGPNSANMPIQQSPADESPSVAEIWKSWLLSGTDQHHRGLTKRQCPCHSATDFNGYGYLIAFLLPAQTTSTHQFASPLESEDPSV